MGEATNTSPAPEESVQFLGVANLSAGVVVITLDADSKRHFLTFMPSPERERGYSKF